MRWARLPADAAPIYQARRLGVVRVFARYGVIFDPGTEIPREGLLGPAPRRPTPLIYTESELGALLAAARRLRSSTGLRPRTYATLIGLLSWTGLRISEALGLTRDDVDRCQATLMIRETKFHKSRLIALHPTTLQALETYARFRDGCHPHPANVAFFVSDGGAPLSCRSVEYTREDVGAWLGQRAGSGSVCSGCRHLTSGGPILGRYACPFCPVHSARSYALQFRCVRRLCCFNR